MTPTKNKKGVFDYKSLIGLGIGIVVFTVVLASGAITLTNYKTAQPGYNTNATLSTADGNATSILNNGLSGLNTASSNISTIVIIGVMVVIVAALVTIYAFFNGGSGGGL